MYIDCERTIWCVQAIYLRVLTWRFNIYMGVRMRAFGDRFAATKWIG